MQQKQTTQSIPTKRSFWSRWRFTTIVRIAAVLFFLFVIAAMVLPICACGNVKKMKVVATKSQLATFLTALDMFQADNGFYPTNLDELVVRPTGLTNWRQYMELIPLDLWGHPYIYKYPGTHGSNSFELISAGPNGVAGDKDDIITNR